MVTSRSRVPASFARLDLAPIGSQHAYLDTSAALPGRIVSAGSISARADLSGITATIAGSMGASGTEERAGATSAAESTELMRLRRVLTYVHESFHCLQADAFVRREKAGLNNKSRPRPSSSLEVTAEYNALAEIEGAALLRAAQATSSADAIAYVKDAFVARAMRQQAMPAGAVVFEQLRTRDEGSATFAALESARLIKERGRPADGARDSIVRDGIYAQLDAYLRTQGIERLQRVMADSDGTSDRYYLYGAYAVLGLDRAFPGWRSDFLEQDRTIDDAAAALLGLTAEERQRASERFEPAYGLSTVRTRHAAAIAAREAAVAALRARTGTTYQIDVSRAQGGFDINPRVGAIFRGREQLYLHGLESLKFGSMRLSSTDTPMRMEGTVIEWVDPEVVAGAKGYTVESDGASGDRLTNVTITTRGFTLTARSVRLVESGNVIRIEVIDDGATSPRAAASPTPARAPARTP
jgi:hypothetical protein